jgi:hypothetical protein
MWDGPDMWNMLGSSKHHKIFVRKPHASEDGRITIRTRILGEETVKMKTERAKG